MSISDGVEIPAPKTPAELRAKLEELLAMDCTKEADARMMFSKAAACKVLLWALGENDDDRWYIRAKPGPPERCSPGVH